MASLVGGPGVEVSQVTEEEAEEDLRVTGEEAEVEVLRVTGEEEQEQALRATGEEEEEEVPQATGVEAEVSREIEVAHPTEVAPGVVMPTAAVVNSGVEVAGQQVQGLLEIGFLEALRLLTNAFRVRTHLCRF